MALVAERGDVPRENKPYLRGTLRLESPTGVIPPFLRLWLCHHDDGSKELLLID